MITMKKISIILLSAVLVFSMAACNGGKEKADNQTEKQTESVKPTEEVAMATEAVTEVTTEAGSEETDKDIAEVKDSEEKTDKLKRFMAGFMAMLTLVGTLFTNGTTAFAASPQANIAFWNASVKNSGEVSELKPGFNHGKILYSILDGNSAYCMNFGLRADGGQLMNSYDDASTSMSAQQRNHNACKL